jgi:segregation and condensation protein B
MAESVESSGSSTKAGARGEEGSAEQLAAAYEDLALTAQDGRVPPEGHLAPPPLERIIEAMLFVGGPPLTTVRATEAIRGLTPEQLWQVVEDLNRTYRQQGRPYRIQTREQGYELALQPRYRKVLDRLYGSMREARLSPAALDVLALVAYRQPVTRQEVESLRGADSASPLRQLVRLGLIAVQRGESGQREVVYSTTPRFLKAFGLTSLEDLPRTLDLQKL